MSAKDASTSSRAATGDSKITNEPVHAPTAQCGMKRPALAQVSPSLSMPSSCGGGGNGGGNDVHLLPRMTTTRGSDAAVQNPIAPDGEQQFLASSFYSMNDIEGVEEV